MSQQQRQRHINNKHKRSKASSPSNTPYRQNGRQQLKLSHNKKSSQRASIPRLPRINRLSVMDEIKLAEDIGMNGMTSHNIASIVNTKTQQTSNFFTEFIWDDDIMTVIDHTPPSYLQAAAKRHITPCRKKRIAASNTKLTPFKSMSQLKAHRFHLAELFQNDDETKKDLQECFDKIPSYFFDEGYEAMPSKRNNNNNNKIKEKEKEKENDSSSTDDDDYKIHQKSRTHNLLLRDCKNHKILRNQQKLANYLDIVEVNLLKQICIQSESFFNGLSNIQLLQNDVCDILSNIKYLRTNLQRMEQYEILSWAQIINLGIKKINYHNLLSMLENIQILQIYTKQLNVLITENKYENAVKMLTQCKIIIYENNEKIPVIAKFEKRLLKIQNTISIKLIYKMVDISIEINENIKKKKKKKKDNNNNNNDDDDDKTRLELEQYIKSCILLQDPSKSVQTIYNTLQTKFNNQISEICDFNNKNTTRKIGNYCITKTIENYIESIDDDNEYILILQNIYFIAEIILESIESICDLFTKYLHDGNYKDYGHINSSSITLYETSSITYCKSLCSEILSLCSILLQCRDKKNSLMRLYQLKSVFAKTLSFLQNIESITNTTCYDIRGVLLKQAQTFLDKFHKQRIMILNQSLESDKWTSVKVPVDVQGQVDQLQSGIKSQNDRNDRNERNERHETIINNHVALEAIIIHIDDKKLLSATSMSKFIDDNSNNNDDDDDDDDDMVYDDVDDLRFKSVNSLLCLIKLVYEYIECAGKLPPIAYDVENKLIELFTLYNSKTCQLVLGAGAMQLVNLKAITAKHLALAQQSISVLLILLPGIHKKWFIKIIPRNCLPLIQSQINRLNEDLEQHSNEIFKKLISIMEDLINFKFDGNDQYQSYLLKIDNNNQSNKAITTHNVKVHPSISSLMQECRKMYRLMSTYMQSYQISIIFKPIIIQFEMKLTVLIDKIKKIHLNKNNHNNHNNDDKPIQQTPKLRDMTEAFHSLNMSIKFISDKLNRLNCDAQHLTNLCIEID